MRDRMSTHFKLGCDFKKWLVQTEEMIQETSMLEKR